MGKVKIKDIAFNIQMTGQGKPLIWGHSLTSSMAGEDALDIFRWNAFPKDVQLVRYDARGHGETESTYRPEDYRWQSLAEDMVAIAEALHLDQFLAGGQSMGCATSILTALRVPHRIKGLILVNPPNAWEMRKSQTDANKKMAKAGHLLGGKLLAKLASKSLRRDLPDWLKGAPDEIVASTLEGLKRMDRRTLSTVFKGAALTDLPPREVVQSIDVPALILAWTGDPTHPVEIAAELNRLLPQSKLAVAKEFSDVERWPEVIQDFVSRIDLVLP